MRARLAIVIGMATIGALVTAGPASALKLGKPAPDVDPGETCVSCNAFQLKTAPSSPSYVVPSGHWKIKSWEAAGNPVAQGEARLLIYRRTGVAHQYKLVAGSDSEQFPPGVITEHSAAINVKGGDRLGTSGGGEFPTTYTSSKLKDVKGTATNCGSLTIGDTVGGGGDCDLDKTGKARVNVGVRIRPRG